MAVFTSFSSSGGGSTAGRPNDAIHSLAAPARAVIQVLVLLLLHFLQGALGRLGLLALEAPPCLAKELSVQMVLGLGMHDALGGHERRGLRRTAGLARHLHGLHERLPDVSHHEAAGGLGVRVAVKMLDQRRHDLHGLRGLGKVLLPFLLEILIHDTAQRGFTHSHAALLGLEHSEQQFGGLILCNVDVPLRIG